MARHDDTTGRSSEDVLPREIEGHGDRALDLAEGLPREGSPSGLQASLRDGPDLFAQGDRVHPQTAISGGDQNLCWIDPASCPERRAWNDDDHGARLVDRVPAEHDDRAASSLLRAFDGIEGGLED